MTPKNIWAVGRNYADHAHELGNEVPKEPLVFLKSGSTATEKNVIILPEWTILVHHELEIALRWDENRQLSDMTLALDLTERHFQDQLKKKGAPWTLAKSFKDSCPVAKEWVPYVEGTNYSIELYVNDILRQQGFANQMIFSTKTLKKYLEAHFPVEPGDFLLTGTPSGVGPILRGDTLKGVLYNELGQTLIETEWLFD